MYDTGGLSLKPTKGSMDMMKCDMAGSAAVVGQCMPLPKANLPYHIIGLIPAVENRRDTGDSAPDVHYPCTMVRQ